jgi:hypothetical protein
MAIAGFASTAKASVSCRSEVPLPERNPSGTIAAIRRASCEPSGHSHSQPGLDLLQAASKAGPDPGRVKTLPAERSLESPGQPLQNRTSRVYTAPPSASALRSTAGRCETDALLEVRIQDPSCRPRTGPAWVPWRIIYSPLIHQMKCYSKALKSHIERARPQFLSLRQPRQSGHSFSCACHRSESRKKRPFPAICPNHAPRPKGPFSGSRGPPSPKQPNHGHFGTNVEI